MSNFTSSFVSTSDLDFTFHFHSSYEIINKIPTVSDNLESFEDYINRKYQNKILSLEEGSTFSQYMAEKYDSTCSPDLADLNEESCKQTESVLNSLSINDALSEIKKVILEESFNSAIEGLSVDEALNLIEEVVVIDYLEQLDMTLCMSDVKYHTLTVPTVNVDAIVEEVAADLRRSTFDDLANCMTVVKKRAAISPNNMEEVDAALLV